VSTRCASAICRLAMNTSTRAKGAIVSSAGLRRAAAGQLLDAALVLFVGPVRHPQEPVCFGIVRGDFDNGGELGDRLRQASLPEVDGGLGDVGPCGRREADLARPHFETVSIACSYWPAVSRLKPRA